MEKINVEQLKQMLINAYNLFSAKIEYINNLNVFPIPDKDTGTNMFLTLSSGINKIQNEKFNNCACLLKNFSKGLLIGARGNSGVIFSQIFAGFYNYFNVTYKNKIIENITISDVQEALIHANNFAKKSVLKPIKGTILTVIQDVSKKSQIKNIKSMQELFQLIMEESNKSLARTPELLKVLKEQNVVDSGAAGLNLCFEGFADYFAGNIHKFQDIHNNKINAIVNSKLIDFNEINFDKNFRELGYCTEGIIYLPNPSKINVKTLKKELLADKCDSVVIVMEDNILKFHVHTLMPWKTLEYFSVFGTFYKLKIENMTFQAEHHHIITNKVPSSDHDHVEDNLHQTLVASSQRKDKAVIIIGRGDGIKDIFQSFGVDYIFSKEDNIIPSINELIHVFKYVNAEEIFLFTNENSVILASKNAKNIFKNSKIHILETYNIFQCYSSLIYLDKNATTEDILKTFNDTMNNIAYSVICKSSQTINSSKNKEVSINKDDYIAILNGEICYSHQDIIKTLDAAISKLSKHKTPEIFTCFLGLDLNSDNEKLVKDYFKANIDVEVEFLNLNQPFQDIIVGVEYKK